MIILDNSNATAYSIKLPLDIDCINSEIITNKTTNSTAKALCEEKVKKYKVDLSDQSYLWFMEILDPVYYGGICVTWCPGLLTSSSSSILSYLNKTAYCPPELDTSNIEVSGFTVPYLSYCSVQRPDYSNESFPINEISRAVSTQLSFYVSISAN